MITIDRRPVGWWRETKLSAVPLAGHQRVVLDDGLLQLRCPFSIVAADIACRVALDRSTPRSGCRMCRFALQAWCRTHIGARCAVCVGAGCNTGENSHR